MRTINEFKKVVNKNLEDFFNKKIKGSDSQEEKELIEVLKDYTLRGGKRIRAFLLYLTYCGLGGKDEGLMIDASLSLELLQSFLLIHDDIIDEDEIRRDGPTPNSHYKKIEGSKKLGDSIAILCGDLAFAYSNELMARTGRIEAIEELNKVTAKVIFGQKRDLRANYAEYDKDGLLKTYNLKTSTYSFYAPMRIGSVLAGKDIDIEEFSRKLGIAFQIQDDILDVYGDEKVIGKPLGSDVKEGKQTMLTFIAKEKPKTVEEARILFEETKAKEHCVRLVEENYTEALQLLERLDLSEEAKEELRSIIVALMDRKY